MPKLEPRPDHPDDVRPSAEMIATYKPFEPLAFNKEAIKRRLIVGMFAENDELLGMKYKDAFIDCYDRVRYMPGGHHGNIEAIPRFMGSLLSGVNTCYRVYEDGTTERFNNKELLSMCRSSLPICKRYYDKKEDVVPYLLDEVIEHLLMS